MREGVKEDFFELGYFIFNCDKWEGIVKGVCHIGVFKYQFS